MLAVCLQGSPTPSVILSLASRISSLLLFPAGARPLASLPPFLRAVGLVSPVASLSSLLGQSLWPLGPRLGLHQWHPGPRVLEGLRPGWVVLRLLPLARPSASSCRRALGLLVDRTPHRPRAPILLGETWSKRRVGLEARKGLSCCTLLTHVLPFGRLCLQSLSCRTVQKYKYLI